MNWYKLRLRTALMLTALLLSLNAFVVSSDEIGSPMSLVTPAAHWLR